MIERALILDTETTGLDHKTDKCIEVACILYDFVEAAPIEIYSSLIRVESNPIAHINNISTDLLLRGGNLPNDVWTRVDELVARTDIIIAHRVEFDKSFVPEDIGNKKPWVCSKFDIAFPKGNLGDHLLHLALAHGVSVHTAHRALADCDTLQRVFQRVHEVNGYESVQRMLRMAMRPKKLYYALVSYGDKDLAKQNAFAWNPDIKQWYRRMSEDDINTLPFKVREVNE